MVEAWLQPVQHCLTAAGMSFLAANESRAGSSQPMAHREDHSRIRSTRAQGHIVDLSQEPGRRIAPLGWSPAFGNLAKNGGRKQRLPAPLIVPLLILI